MAEIRILPDAVRNRIAAGEVIERPANIVKELVENSLDAGARSITVNLDDGGIGEIRISDDGCGISADDLRVAVLQHATSKIHDTEDIFRIASLGFRGEALPSIAAVSRLEIVSRGKQSEEGRRLLVDGGEILEEAPRACSVGTSVTVRDLFHTTPARRKFLKSARAEVASVHEWLTRLALGHPEVGFQLHSDGREILACSPHEDALERIAALFGRQTAGALQPVSMQVDDGLAVSGFIAPPPESRGNSRGIYCFINRRWIQSAALSSVVRQAFEGALPQRRFPIAFLYIAISPDRVDVNVHPAKLEVRFREERLVYSAVHRSVQAALRGSGPDGRSQAPSASADEAGTSGPNREAPIQAHEPLALYEKRSAPAERFSGAGRGADALQISRQSRPSKGTPDADSASPGLPEEALAGMEGPQGKGGYRVLGQLGQSYFVLEARGGMVVVDQHALHERLIYEDLLGRDGPPAVQSLLLPVELELSESEWQTYESARKELHSAGFRLKDAEGRTALSVEGVPAVLRRARADELLRETLGALEQGGEVSDVREPLIRTIACKAAIKAGDWLEESSVVALLERLRERDIPFTCPHGRPFVWVLGWDELERRFERR